MKFLCAKASLLLLSVSLSTGQELETLVAPPASENSDSPNANTLYLTNEGHRLHTVYNAENFLGAMPLGGTLNSLSYRIDSEFGRNVNHSGILEVWLSTTPSTAATISDDYSKNIGSDYRRVLAAQEVRFEGVYTRGTVHPFNLTIPFDTPFPYNPNAGNLLVDIFLHRGGGEPSLPLDAAIDSSVQYRGGGFLPPAIFGNVGPATQFSFIAVPEPCSVSIGTVAGVLLILFSRRKR